MTTFNLDAESMAPLVQQAILDKISPEQRDKLVSDAIASLLVTPKRNTYGVQQGAPINEAFTMAIHSAAVSIVRQQVADNPDVQAKILDLVSAPIAEIAQGNYDGLPEKIGEAIGSSVADWLRDRSR